MVSLVPGYRSAIRSISQGMRRMGLPNESPIQVFSMKSGSQRLRGACKRAATVLGDTSFSVMRLLPRFSGYQCTSRAWTRRLPCLASSRFASAKKKSR